MSSHENMDTDIIVTHNQMYMGQYQEWHNKRYIDMRKTMKSHVYSRLRTSLMQDPYGYESGIAEKTARDLLDPDADFHFNSYGDDDEDEDEDIVTRELNLWNDMELEKLLMLRFPLPENMQPKTKYGELLPLHLDDKSRQMQNESFVKLYCANSSVQAHHCSIENAPDIHNCIHSFLYKKCVNVCLASIVFNGHGGSEGLAVHHSGAVNLDGIINEAKTCFLSHRYHSAWPLPLQLDLIFGQCFGHKYNYVPLNEDKLNVISLTSAQSRGHERTMSIVRPLPLKRFRAAGQPLNDIELAENRTLNNFGEKRRKLGSCGTIYDFNIGDIPKISAPLSLEERVSKLPSLNSTTQSRGSNSDPVNVSSQESAMDFEDSGLGTPREGQSSSQTVPDMDMSPDLEDCADYSDPLYVTPSGFTPELQTKDENQSMSNTAGFSGLGRRNRRPGDLNFTPSYDSGMFSSTFSSTNTDTMDSPETVSRSIIGSHVPNSGRSASDCKAMKTKPSPLSLQGLTVTSTPIADHGGMMSPTSPVFMSPVTHVPLRLTPQGSFGDTGFRPAAPDMLQGEMFPTLLDIIGDIDDVSSIEEMNSQ